MYDDFKSTHFGVDHVNGVKKCQETLDDTCRRLNDMASEVESFKELTDVPDTGYLFFTFWCGKYFSQIGTASAGETHSLARRTNPPPPSIVHWYGVV